MRDFFGREIDYVRISITDRCNLRCIYCMPAEGIPDKKDHDEILSYEGILQIVQTLARLGIKKVKITGGEPLVRKDCCALAAGIKQIPGIKKVTMTTNGLLLSQHVDALQRAGLDGVNISLDTLQPQVFQRITRFSDIELVLKGIDAALAAGIPSVKLNCIPMVGMNESDLVGLAAFAKQHPIQVRFIEMMPIGWGVGFGSLSGSQVRSLLEDAYGDMVSFVGKLGNGPASYYTLPGFKGQIGFISAVSSCFCERCNHIRLTSTGMLKTCLNFDSGIELAPILATRDPKLLEQTLRTAILQKPEHHTFFHNNGSMRPETRMMSQIGG